MLPAWDPLDVTHKLQKEKSMNCNDNILSNDPRLARMVSFFVVSVPGEPLYILPLGEISWGLQFGAMAVASFGKTIEALQTCSETLQYLYMLPFLWLAPPTGAAIFTDSVHRSSYILWPIAPKAFKKIK